MTDVLEANKALVLAFYQKALNERDADVADTFLGNRYVQHNPLVEDGPAGLRRYLGWIAANVPDPRSEAKRVFADEGIVILHIHRVRTPGTHGDAIVDLFRVKDGRIVEHWDVTQPVPETATNNSDMFRR
jgi:predicted SnoaL-like aldol condensation-catalyzing enzyme